MFENLLINEKIVYCSYIAVIGLVLIGIIAFAVILARIASGKFIKSCKKISNFCNDAGIINDDNLEQFEATCLDDHTNAAFLEGWEAFKAARFGYPGEHIDKERVLSAFDDHKFKLGVTVYSLVLFILDIVAAVYAIIATRDTDQYALVFALCSMIIPLIPLAIYLPFKPRKKGEAAFDQTLEDLDTAVRLQRYVERKIDNSRINEINDKIVNVILSEQSKPIPSKKDQLAKMAAFEEDDDDEDLDDIRNEIVDSDTPEFIADEPVVTIPSVTVPVVDMSMPGEKDVEETPVENAAVEEAAVEEAPFEETPVEEAPVEETSVEDTAAEDVPAEDTAVEEKPTEEAPASKKKIKFEPFVAVLDEAIIKIKSKATLKKLGFVIVLAYGKFKEPEQREVLKNSIRKFIVSYKSAIVREAEEAAKYEAAEVVDENAVADEKTAEFTDETVAEETPKEEIAVTPYDNAVPADYDTEEMRDEFSIDLND